MVPPITPTSSATPSLKTAFKDVFLVGVAINSSHATGHGTGRRSSELVGQEIALIKAQFNQISPDNDLKWEKIHPRNGADGYNFGPADAYVDFGENNGLLLVGHTLVWHNQTPDWVFAGTNPPPQSAHSTNRVTPGYFKPVYAGPRASREELLERMRDHIHKVVGRYKGKVKVWDVVNEALADGPPENYLRDSLWMQIIGPDFIAKAFQYAHEADPDVILRYNDFALENPVKVQKLVSLIKSLQEQKVPIHAIGTQSHLNLDSAQFEKIDRSLDEIAKLGIPIHITELDLSGGNNDEKQLAYEGVFRAVMKHRDSVKLVTFWGVDDAVSWLRDGSPLLFDGNCQPKPAFDAVIRVAKETQTVVLPAVGSSAEDVAIHKKALAPTPPLGWNSYDSYGNQIREEETLRNLEVFAKKLAPHGYQYFVLDLGWYSEDVCIPGSVRSMGNILDFALDGNGYPIGSRTYFPNGMKRIADRAHKLGVKFGLHMMRGMVRKAWVYNLPVKGTPYRMRDIADTNNACLWANFTYGVDMTKPGAQEYYDGVIQHLADMGVDMIKYDDVVNYPPELEAIGKAVAKCKRDILLSLSPGDDTTPKNKDYYKLGHMLRITGDVWDSHSSLNNCFKRWRDWQGAAEPGFWPDMDMLCLGTLNGMCDPATQDERERRNLKPEELGRKNLEEVFFRPCHFTPGQEHTFLTLRAMSASPLFMGGCLLRSEQRVFDVITDRDVLACNQNGVSGTLQSQQASIDVWRTPKAGKLGQGWIGVFNRNETAPVTFTPSFNDFGLPGGSYRFRSIWTKEPVNIDKPVTIAPDDVLFLEYGSN